VSLGLLGFLGTLLDGLGLFDDIVFHQPGGDFLLSDTCEFPTRSGNHWLGARLQLPGTLRGHQDETELAINVTDINCQFKYLQRF